MADEQRVEAEERRRESRLFDMDAAQEVVEVLGALQQGRCGLSWDAVGYLLRSFYSAMRKHVRAEREIVKFIQTAMEREDQQRSAVGTEAA